MSGSAKGWIIVGIFFLSFFAITYLEAKWLSKNAATAFARSFAAVFLPNVFTITVGFAFSAIVFGLVLMFVFNEPQNAGVGETTVRAGVALALLAPLTILIFAKRFTLLIFKLEAVRSPWLYSIIASALFIVAVFIPVFAVGYFI